MKVSNRIRIGHAVVAGFVFLAISLGNAAAVRADLVASFASGGTADYTYTGGTTASTLDSTGGAISGTITYGSSFFVSAPVTGTLDLTATSMVAAVPAFGVQGGFSGTLTIADGSHTITVTFSGYQLNVGSGSATLQTALSGSTTSISANFGNNSFSQPETLSLSLTGLAPNAPGAGSFGFANFTGNDSGNTSASLTIASVPEPSSLAIAGIGALGLIGYGLRRRKALGA